MPLRYVPDELEADTFVRFESVSLIEPVEPNDTIQKEAQGLVHFDCAAGDETEVGLVDAF